MLDTLDELTYDLEADGVLVRRQLERVVLARGAWATVLFLYEERDRETGVFGAPKIAFVRFKKLRGAYRKHAAFSLASVAQARELADVLARWGARLDAEEVDEASDEASVDEASVDDRSDEGFEVEPDEAAP